VRTFFPLMEAAVADPAADAAAGGGKGADPAADKGGGGAIQPFHSDWMKADGTLNPAAYERLPEDIRYMKDGLGKYKTAEELVRGMAYAQTLAGKKGLMPLPDNAPVEVRAERKAILDSINGVPKEAKDYGIARPPEVPEQQWNQPLADNFAKWAQENSVSPAAVKKLTAIQIDAMKGQLAEQAKYEHTFYENHQKAFEAQLRTENIPLDRATALVERGAISLGLDVAKPEHATLLKNSAVRLMAMRHAIATGEDSFVQGEAGKGDAGDPMTLAQDATHNKANPLYEPLHDSSHPQHKMAAAKVEGWWRQAAAKPAKR
jgi:hypothetical protein